MMARGRKMLRFDWLSAPSSQHQYESPIRSCYLVTRIPFRWVKGRYTVCDI